MDLKVRLVLEDDRFLNSSKDLDCFFPSEIVTSMRMGGLEVGRTRSPKAWNPDFNVVINFLNAALLSRIVEKKVFDPLEKWLVESFIPGVEKKWTELKELYKSDAHPYAGFISLQWGDKNSLNILVSSKDDVNLVVSKFEEIISEQNQSELSKPIVFVCDAAGKIVRPLKDGETLQEFFHESWS